MKFFVENKRKVIIAVVVLLIIGMVSGIIYNHNKTAPVPEVNKNNTVSLTVQCKDVLDNIDKLKKEKQSIIPSDGKIYSNADASFSEGETVFDLLQRELKMNKIHMDFVNTPPSNSAYIRGINNLYEFDCGEQSGWGYTVNGEMPDVGCSQYKLQPGDDVEFYYFCEYK